LIMGLQLASEGGQPLQLGKAGEVGNFLACRVFP